MTTAIAAREAAIDRAETGAGLDWIDEAYDVLFGVARRHAYLSSDDLFVAGLRAAPEPRALGAVFRKAYREGIIEPTDNFMCSIMRSCHRRPKRIWRSTIQTAHTW